MSKLVNVFVCGVQKGGTTSLDMYLCEHPQMSPPKIKEVKFFDDDERDWKAPNYADLDAFYKPNDGDRLRFDVSPDYVFWPNAIERLHAYNPAARIILLFRDPFDRAWSNWCMVYAREKENLTFEQAIREGRKRLGKLPSAHRKQRIYPYIERGYYAWQVKRILKYFPRDQILFLRTQDFSADYMATLGQIASFLSIAPFVDTGVKRENRRSEITLLHKPTEADRELIANTLYEDVMDFSKLTGLSVADWTVVREATNKGKGGVKKLPTA